jgi:hypothetical protein
MSTATTSVHSAASRLRRAGTVPRTALLILACSVVAVRLALTAKMGFASDGIWGLAELVLYPLALVLGVVALLVPRVWLARIAVTGLAMTALTLAQPFGIVAKDAGIQASTSQERLGGVHTVDVLGLPLFRVKPYISEGSRDPLAGRRQLNARSWLWPGLLVHTAWLLDDDRAETQLRSTTIVRGPSGDMLLREPSGSAYQLSVGITSPAGVFFWVTGALLTLGIWLVRRRLDAIARRFPRAGTAAQ